MVRQRIAASVALAGCVAGLCHAQTPKADPARWVPADALVYVGASDPAALTDGFEKSAWGRILDRAALLDGPLKHFAELRDKLKQQISAALGLRPETLAMPTGPIAFYLTPSNEAGVGTHFVLTFGVSDSDATRNRYAAALKRLALLDREHIARPMGGWTIDTLRRRPRERVASAASIENDRDVNPFGMDSAAFTGGGGKNVDGWLSPDAMPETIAACLTGSRVIISDSPRAVEAALAMTDESRSFAARVDYQALLSSLGEVGPLRIVVDLPRLLESAATDGPRAAASARLRAGIGSLIAHVDFGRDDCDIKIEAMLLKRGEPAGLMKLLMLPNRRIEPPKYVPGDAAAYAWLNAGAGQVFDAVEKTRPLFGSPAGAAMAPAIGEFRLPGGGTLDLRDGLIDHLKPPLSATISIARPNGAEWTRVVAGSTLGGTDPIEPLIAALPPGLLAARDIAGGRIYDAPVGGISLAVGRDTFFVGSRAAVSAALQPAGERLSADTNFRRAAALVPDEAWLVLYTNGRRSIERLLASHERRVEVQPTFTANLANLLALTVAERLAKQFGQSTPAKIRELTRLLAPVIVICRTEPSGIRLTCAVLKPESN